MAEPTQNQGFIWKRICAGPTLESRYLAAVADTGTEGSSCHTLAF